MDFSFSGKMLFSAVPFWITLFMFSHFFKSISKSFRFGPKFIET